MRLEANVAILVQRIGPYHDARFRAFSKARAAMVSVIEFRPEDPVYAWTEVRETGGYHRLRTRSRTELSQALDELRPIVLVCVGYADPEINQAVAWALRRKAPLITCSDSTREDEPRRRAKEALKRRMIDSFDAALISGSRAREYLTGLGFDDRRIFRPWDVVDNGHFERGAERSRSGSASLRAHLSLPSRFFFCVARFVPKKNLAGLIDAYARYAAQAGGNAWSLVLSGGGPLDASLRAQAAALGVGRQVVFVGFLQHTELPKYYGLANAFVLPSNSDQWGLVVNEAMAAGLPVIVSSRCGCARDLVDDGGNGFIFEPGVPEVLAGCLAKMARLNDEQRAAMGVRSREIIRQYSPEAFAAGLEAAIECAVASQAARKSWLGRALVNLAALRSIPIDHSLLL